MYWIVDILKALACLLILNFHSDACYPEKLKILAFGGDIGNNLFFLVSGFTLLPSIVKHGNSFVRWYKGRAERVLPLHIFFTIASAICMGYTLSIINLFKVFVFPAIYWFTTAIMVFYVILYFYEKIENPKIRWGGVLLLCVMHLIFDSVYAEQYIIGIIAMIVGAEIRRKDGNDKTVLYKHKWRFVIEIIIEFAGFMMLKLIRARGIEVYGLIHLSIGLLTVVMAITILKFGVEHEHQISSWFQGHQLIGKIVKVISGAALSTYLITVFNDYIIVKTVSQIGMFPVSYICNVVITLLLAIGTTKTESLIIKRKSTIGR